MKLVATMLGLSLSLCSSVTFAQVTLLGTAPVIGGAQVQCGGAMTVVMPLNDLAQAVPGEIRLNPRLFSYPSDIQIFVYAHECAHQLYGGGPAGEAAADCWAMKTGRDQGWLPPAGAAVVAQSVAGTAGDWSHAPGPQRVANMQACYNTP